MKKLIVLFGCLMVVCALFTSTVSADNDNCSNGFDALEDKQNFGTGEGDPPFYPTCYKHQLFSYYGGEKTLFSEMQFNTRERVEQIETYRDTDWSEDPRYRRYEYHCISDCPGYYTQDHSTLDDCYMSSTSFYTNLPDPIKPDYDAQWCYTGEYVITIQGVQRVKKWMNHEVEVATLNEYFPVQGHTYYFESVWESVVNGEGVIESTPQISIKADWGDYNTWNYMYRPETEKYTVSGQGHQMRSKTDVENVEARPATFATNTSEIATQHENESPQTLIVTSWQNMPAVQVELDRTHFAETRSKNRYDESDFVAWSKNLPTTIQSIQEQRGMSGTKALTTVTFERPVSSEQIDAIFSEDEIADFTHVRAKLFDLLSEEESTLDTQIMNNAHYEDVLNGMITQRSMLADFEIGLTYIRTWLDLETVRELNLHPDIYLADASPTYLRLEASDSVDVQNIQEDAEVSAESVDISYFGLGDVQDGVDDLIMPEFVDVYGNFHADESPTAVSTQQVILSREFIRHVELTILFLVLITTTVLCKTSLTINSKS